MADISNKDKEIIERAEREFDYIRLTFPDIHGIARGRSCPTRNLKHFIHNGYGVFSGTVGMGPRSEVTHFPEIEKTEFGNGLVILQPETLHPLPWADKEGQYRVGEILCDTHWDVDGCPVQDAASRAQAMRQLERLEKLGLKLYHAWEVEFIVSKEDTMEPVFSGNDYVNMQITAQSEDFLFELERSVHKAGVSVELMCTEYSPGQFEITFRPTFGILNADSLFIFRSALKEICKKRGLHATMMSKPRQEVGNGLHLNHSLFNEAGKNVTGDVTKQYKLSDIGRWWLGGLMKHAISSTAIFSPTVNCYRRLHTTFAPDKANWATESRTVAVRLKNENPKNTYLELRSIAGSTNPYLALAATVAAGIDGIENKIEPPFEKDPNAPVFPFSLSEALEKFNDDEYWKQALGKQFVDWFIRLKNETEIDQLPLSRDVRKWNDAAVKEELHKYEFL